MFPVASEPFSRQRLALAALLALTLTAVVLSVWVATPFLSGLTWGFSLAVVAGPVHRWIVQRIPRPNLAAFLAVVLVAAVLIVPVAGLSWIVAQQAAEGVEQIQELHRTGAWRDKVNAYPRLTAAYHALTRNVDLSNQANHLFGFVQSKAAALGAGAVQAGIQGTVALFSLFYFFRDRAGILQTLRIIAPLSPTETSFFFSQIESMTYATIYGSVAVAALQGLAGGVMWFWLGLPAAALWGAVMAVCSLIPVFGSYLVWAPASLSLLVQGDWVRALILAAWGAVVVGSLDNILYPVFVGGRIRLHTLVVFIAIVGGLIVFGASGLVLGPIVVSAALTLLQILHERTALGGSADSSGG